MKSTTTNRFSQVPKVTIPRSSFNRSSGLKTTFNTNEIVPIFLDHAVPGDTFNLKMTAFARMSTPIYPVMDNLFLEHFWFSIPYRLLWDNWAKFNGEQTDPGDSTDFLIPVISKGSPGYDNQTLADYLGVPTLVTTGLVTHSALPFRAYALCINEWFRDENLTDSIAISTGDGPDSNSAYTLQKRSKRHDYFTSALPWPQKGDSVSMPLGTSAPINTDGIAGSSIGVYSTDASGYKQQTANAATVLLSAVGSNQTDSLYADLSAATSATINQLRQSFQIQTLYERDARGGSRIIEIVKSHFGVTSPDLRAMRPELLATGHTTINISPIQQTSETAATPLGTLAAQGTASVNAQGFTKSFTEHCVILGLVNVRADLTYQQGLPKDFSRQTRFDFYWPALAQIGEQAILNSEIYYTGTSTDTDVFGYQERFAEMRYRPSQVTGRFRSNDPLTLDSWHLAQDFGSLPLLNQTFIEEDVPMDRVLAVSTALAPNFIFDAYFQLTCVRPMPLYGVPYSLSRF